VRPLFVFVCFWLLWFVFGAACSKHSWETTSSPARLCTSWKGALAGRPFRFRGGYHAGWDIMPSWDTVPSWDTMLRGIQCRRGIHRHVDFCARVLALALQVCAATTRAGVAVRVGALSARNHGGIPPGESGANRPDRLAGLAGATNHKNKTGIKGTRRRRGAVLGQGLPIASGWRPPRPHRRADWAK
jgi:hypothetical protein